LSAERTGRQGSPSPHSYARWQEHPASATIVGPSRTRPPDQEPLVDRSDPTLRTPGPPALPPTVREAGGRQMINHRGPEFAAMLGRILEGMKRFFETTHDVAPLPCAG